jgi:predicted transcriptional regulator
MVKIISEKNKKKYLTIKSLMVLRGIKQVDIAKKLRVSQPAVSQTLMGKIDSKRIKREIANALNESVHKLWPDAKRKQ